MEKDQNEFIGDIKGIGFSPEQEQKIKEKIWVQKENEKLKQSDLDYKLVSTNDYYFFKVISVIFVLGILFIGGYFLYLMKEDKFKSDLTQPINIDPSFNHSISNKYNIENPVSNQFNNTFQFNLNISEELIKRYCNQS